MCACYLLAAGVFVADGVPVTTGGAPLSLESGPLNEPLTEPLAVRTSRTEASLTVCAAT